MNQTALFGLPDQPIVIIKQTSSGIVEQHPWGQKRNFNGFVQYKLKDESCWRFNIIGFSGKPLLDGTDSIGHVALFNGGSTECKMDMKDRVNVCGKWYGRTNWDH